jgi:hypothetical protein
VPGAAADPVERALVSDRLGRIEELLERHEGLDQKMLVQLERLVELEERRAAREEEELEIERERRRASQEAEARRLDAELTERREARNWVRERVALPMVTALTGAIAGVGTTIGAWMAGWFGGSR